MSAVLSVLQNAKSRAREEEEDQDGRRKKGLSIESPFLVFY
jgi:hypothetical protein